jgi:uncharacterized protein (DUF362 family)
MNDTVSTPRPRIYLEGLDRGYLALLREAFERLGLAKQLRPGGTVFIKPNLTFPVFRPGVMTTTECVEALVVALKDYTDRIIIGEADSGGYNRFSIDEVQARTGLKAFEQMYGIRVINLSRFRHREIAFTYRGRAARMPLPVLLTDEIDLLVSAAVPKIHMNTMVSMSVKNLWGCIPEPAMRLRLHPFFPQAVREIVRAVAPAWAVIDGRYGLTRSGPMRGDPVDLNWLMVADDLYAADAMVCRLMGIDPRSVYYLRHVAGKGLAPAPEQMDVRPDWAGFRKEPFYLRRAWTDYPGLWAFRSSFLTYWFYYSPLAGLLHKLLYLFREPFYDYKSPSRTDS